MNHASSDGNPIEVLPATADHWPEVEQFFATVPCWCQYWRQSAGEYGRHSKEEMSRSVLPKRRRALHRRLEAPTPPGMLAYSGGALVGWCGIGPRTEMERLVRSRTIPAVDDREVWSIVCFVVRPGFRRRGVARALLRGAIRCARSFSVPALEAYPVDPKDVRLPPTAAYVGTRTMFEREGFRRVAETAARSGGLKRWLMRLDLAPDRP